jgi:hypothetical protein
LAERGRETGQSENPRTLQDQLLFTADVILEQLILGHSVCPDGTVTNHDKTRRSQGVSGVFQLFLFLRFEGASANPETAYLGASNPFFLRFVESLAQRFNILKNEGNQTGLRRIVDDGP